MVAKTDPPQEKMTLAQQIVGAIMAGLFLLMLLALGAYLALGGMGFSEVAEVFRIIGAVCLGAVVVLAFASLYKWPPQHRKGKEPIDPFDTGGFP